MGKLRRQVELRLLVWSKVKHCMGLTKSFNKLGAIQRIYYTKDLADHFLLLLKVIVQHQLAQKIQLKQQRMDLLFRQVQQSV